MRAWRLLRPADLLARMGVLAPSPSSISPSCWVQVQSSGVICFGLCVWPCCQDLWESVEGFCAQETPLSELQHLSLGLGEDERAEGSQHLAHTRHRHPASRHMEVCAGGPTGMRSAPFTPRAYCLGSSLVGLGWGARLCGPVAGEREREGPLLSFLKVTPAGDPVATHPHTCACTYMTQCL